jgi:hypothetical protein
LGLLGLRAAPKEVSGISSAEAVYGQPLTLPGELSCGEEAPPTDFRDRLASASPPPTSQPRSYAEVADSPPGGALTSCPDGVYKERRQWTSSSTSLLGAVPGSGAWAQVLRRGGRRPSGESQCGQAEAPHGHHSGPCSYSPASRPSSPGSQGFFFSLAVASAWGGAVWRPQMGGVVAVNPPTCVTSKSANPVR